MPSSVMMLVSVDSSLGLMCRAASGLPARMWMRAFDGLDADDAETV
jgi:hypothetical protein